MYHFHMKYHCNVMLPTYVLYIENKMYKYRNGIADVANMLCCV